MNVCMYIVTNGTLQKAYTGLLVVVFTPFPVIVIVQHSTMLFPTQR